MKSREDEGCRMARSRRIEEVYAESLIAIRPAGETRQRRKDIDVACGRVDAARFEKGRRVDQQGNMVDRERQIAERQRAARRSGARAVIAVQNENRVRAIGLLARFLEKDSERVIQETDAVV